MSWLSIRKAPASNLGQNLATPDHFMAFLVPVQANVVIAKSRRVSGRTHKAQFRITSIYSSAALLLLLSRVGVCDCRRGMDWILGLLTTLTLNS
jgi:hypothetical protein